MKIVKPINVTDEVLVDSSIPMPDTVRGEEEWQTEIERRFILNYQAASMTIIDSIYISGFDLISVVRKSGNEYAFINISESGLITNEAPIQTSANSEVIQFTGLEYVDFGGTGDVVCGIAQYRTDPDGMIPDTEKRWRFGTRGVRIDFSLTSAGNLPDSVVARYIDKPSNAVFRMLSRRIDTPDPNQPSGILETVWSYFSPDEPAEVTIINPFFGETTKNIRVFDFCFVGQNLLAITESFLNERGSRVLVAETLNRELESIKKTEVKFESETQAMLFISEASGLISVSSKGAGNSFVTEVYSGDLINIGAYRRNDEVIKSSTKRKYRCAVDATFDDPELGVNLSPPTWVDIGAVNRWLPFDRQPAQQAVSDDPMYYKLKPSEFVRTLSIFNISRVTNINVKVTDPVDGVIYDKDFDLVDNSNVVDMWTYLTLPISFKKELIITDLVCFRDSEIEITINGDNPAVGAIVTGNESPAGRCVTGTGVRSNQFSIRKENGFGGFDIIQRGVGKIVRFRVAYDISQIEYLTNLLESIDSVYCVFIGDLPNGKTISVYGVLDPYQSDFETPTVNTLEFDVLGVL